MAHSYKTLRTMLIHMEDRVLRWSYPSRSAVHRLVLLKPSQHAIYRGSSNWLCSSLHSWLFCAIFTALRNSFRFNHTV